MSKSNIDIKVYKKYMRIPVYKSLSTNRLRKVLEADFAAYSLNYFSQLTYRHFTPQSIAVSFKLESF